MHLSPETRDRYVNAIWSGVALALIIYGAAVLLVYTTV